MSVATHFYSKDFVVYAIGMNVDGEFDDQPRKLYNLAELAPVISEDLRRPLVEQLAARIAEKLNEAYNQGWQDSAVESAKSFAEEWTR